MRLTSHLKVFTSCEVSVEDLGGPWWSVFRYVLEVEEAGPIIGRVTGCLEKDDTQDDEDDGENELGDDRLLVPEGTQEALDEDSLELKELEKYASHQSWENER